jgi:hypothetical protein
VIKSKILYEAQSVVRVLLEAKECSDVEEDKEERNISYLFSRFCYSIMTNGDKDNIVMHEAPRYELRDLTGLRNDARRDACSNAKEKATFIIDALDDENITLGKPVCFTDIHCNIEDDAQESFCGNLANFSSWNVTKIIMKNGQVDEEKNEDHRKKQSASKRRRIEKDDKENDKELSIKEMSRIFTVPPIKVVACIKAVFEIECTNRRRRA